MSHLKRPFSYKDPVNRAPIKRISISKSAKITSVLLAVLLAIPTLGTGSILSLYMISAFSKYNALKSYSKTANKTAKTGESHLVTEKTKDTKKTAVSGLEATTPLQPLEVINALPDNSYGLLPMPETGVNPSRHELHCRSVFMMVPCPICWLGLTPRQHSSGGKNRLGHITKRGDAYLRGLLVQGARAALHTAMRHTDRMSRWALSVQGRRGYRRALVAIAAKNARIAWALLSKNQTLRPA